MIIGTGEKEKKQVLPRKSVVIFFLVYSPMFAFCEILDTNGPQTVN